MSWQLVLSGKINLLFICLHLSAKCNFWEASKRILYSGFWKKLLNSFISGKCLSFAGNTFFLLTTDIWSRLTALLTLPTFYVNYIISMIIIYSYNHWSRMIPSKYCFENFAPIIFSMCRLSHSLFLCQLKILLKIVTVIPYLRLQYNWSNQHFQMHFLQNFGFLILSYCRVLVEYR